MSWQNFAASAALLHELVPDRGSTPEELMSCLELSRAHWRAAYVGNAGWIESDPNETWKMRVKQFLASGRRPKERYEEPLVAALDIIARLKLGAIDGQ